MTYKFEIMFTYPYLIIKSLLGNIAELKEIDWFLNQYSRADKSAMLFTTPAAYVQFTDAPTEAIGGKIQTATTTVIIHLVTDNVASTDKRMQKATATDHANLMDAIYKQLDGMGGLLSDITGNEALKGTENDVRIFNTLTREKITSPHDLRNKIISTHTFKAVFYDHSKAKEFQKIAANLEVT